MIQFTIEDISDKYNSAIKCPTCKNLTDVTTKKCFIKHKVIGVIQISNFFSRVVLPVTHYNIKSVLNIDTCDSVQIMTHRTGYDEGECVTFKSLSINSHMLSIFVNQEEMVNIRQQILDIIRSWNIQYLESLDNFF